MEKLIRLAQIFECTLDELISGDPTARPVEQGTPTAHDPQDICGYDQAMRAFAVRLASGVGAIVGGIGVAFLLEALAGPVVTEGFIAVAFVLAAVAAGVALIMPACMRRSAFNREHPFAEDFYTAQDRDAAGRLLGWGIGGGVALILAGVVLDVFLDGWNEYVGTAALLLAIGAGVWLTVYTGVMHARTDVDAYNLEIAEKMSYQEIDEVADPALRGQLRLHKRRGALTGTLCSICILLASIVGLILLFSGNDYFWLSWAIGGISCGIASAAVELAVRE